MKFAGLSFHDVRELGQEKKGQSLEISSDPKAMCAPLLSLQPTVIA